VDGALFDLGVSSHQIDQPERGFAHRFHGDLDMRMDQSAPPVSSGSNGHTEPSITAITALELINALSVEELDELLAKFGDESRSLIIAREVVLSRPLQTTSDLKEAICRVTPPKYEVKTLSRCFQALRIAVNNELVCLEEALKAVHSVTRPGGRLVVLSYHSLEDRIIKDLFRRHGRVKKVYTQNLNRDAGRDAAGTETGTEVTDKQQQQLWCPVFKKPITPSRRELKENSRSRSAKLRVAERL
jgi:16S rRNA (cytosine1402-N4)-methyltransferase